MRAHPLEAGGVEDGGENSTVSGAESIIRGVHASCLDGLRLDATEGTCVTSLERLISDSLCDRESLCFRAAKLGCGFLRSGLMMLSRLQDRQSDLSAIDQKRSFGAYQGWGNSILNLGNSAVVESGFSIAQGMPVFKALIRSVLLGCVLGAPVICTAATPASNATYPVDTANWAVTSAWIKELPKDDQVIVLVLLVLAIDNHVSQVLIPHIENPKGALWVMKTSGNGSNMLMGLATKSNEMRQLLKEKADAHLELINKRISPDGFDRINDDVNKRIMEFSEYVKP